MAKKFKARDYLLGDDYDSIFELQEYAEKTYGNTRPSPPCENFGVVNKDIDLIVAMGDEVPHTARVKSQKALNDKELMKMIRENEANEYTSPDSEDGE